MDLLRVGWGILAVASLALGACEDGGDGMDTEGGDEGSTTAGMSGPTSAPSTTTPATTGPIDCIPGQETCVCLEGDCIGSLFCVEDVCQPGPEFEVPEDPIRVIAGLRVPIEAEVLADEFSWAQSAGPDAELEGVDAPLLLVDVPEDAAAGDTLTLTLSAVRNSVEAEAEVVIEVVGVEFREGLPGIDDAEQLGTATAIDFRGGELWASSAEGFVSWFDMDFDDETEMDVAFHIGRHEIPGSPVSLDHGQVPGDDNEIDVLLVANTANEAVEAVALSGGAVETISSTTVDGDPVGTVRDVISAGGELFFTNGEGGQLLAWDPAPPNPDKNDDTPLPAATRVLLSDLATPTSLSLGPEPNVLYVGTLGQVLRVPILEDGSAGDPAVYLDIGDTTDPLLEIGGIRFDRGQNIYVGVPMSGRLVVARYVAGDSTELVRDLGGAADAFSGFQSLVFGEGDFGGGTLYYANPSGRVGRVYVGLGD